MSKKLFKAGGPLTAEDEMIYVEREADRMVYEHLIKMDYILLIEPRQQGKTSLIYKLMRTSSLRDKIFINIYAATLDQSNEITWYRNLCERIIEKLKTYFIDDLSFKIPQDGDGWRKFLSDLGNFAFNHNKKLVIILDEIGSISFSGATLFFSVLREVYDSRETEQEFKLLTFILSGVFHPRDLIKDIKVSPFNIAQRVRLYDFTLAQVKSLLSKGYQKPEKDLESLANSIFYWTNGQPYLTQLLCKYLENTASQSDVTAAIKRIRREDDKHLMPMLERINRNQKLCKFVNRVQDKEIISLYPGENRIHSQLELIGIVKSNEKGYCIIRNRIYAEAIENMGIKQMAKREQVFICYSHKDSKFLESLKTMLAPYIRDKIIKVWDDTQIKPGSLWKKEIKSAIKSAKIAVLLVSSDFLASDFIARNELPPLLKASENEGLAIIWVAVRDCLWEDTILKEYQSANNPKKPLDSLSKAHQDRELVLICKKIKAAIDS